MSYLREPTKMCCSCCFISFWDTKYNTPHVFCLASYSTILHGSGASVLLLRLYCCLAFPCEVRLNNYLLTFSNRNVGVPWYGYHPI